MTPDSSDQIERYCRSRSCTIAGRVSSIESSTMTGPAVFFNAKQVQDARTEAQNIIVYRHHSAALQHLEALDKELLADSPETASQSALYTIGDILHHVSSCLSDQDERDRLDHALDDLQYR